MAAKRGKKQAQPDDQQPAATDSPTVEPAETLLDPVEPALTVSMAPLATVSPVVEEEETGFVADEEEETGFVADEEEKTGFVADEEEKTGFVADEEEKTGFVAASPTQALTSETALKEEGEEGEETYIHDPWGPVLSLASAAATLASMPTPTKQRFTGNRILLFMALVLVVILLFVGGGFALLAVLAPQNSVQLIQPTQQQPTQLVQRQTMMTPPPAGMQPTLQDNFQRQTDLQGSWGTASNASGATWQITSPQRVAGFSVAGNIGMIASPATQQGDAFYTATLGKSNAIEAMATFSMQFTRVLGMQQQPANFGVLLHWQDQANYDKAYIDGAQLVIVENRAGQQTVLARVPFSAVSGSAYTLRFRVQDQTLQAKVWLQSGAEPAGWQLSSKSNLMTGLAGIRALLLPASTVQVTAFQLTTG